MIALYIPMQPSSKTPRMAWSRCSASPSSAPRAPILGVVSVERPVLDRPRVARVVVDAPLREPLRAAPRARSRPRSPRSRSCCTGCRPWSASRSGSACRRGPATRRSSWRASGSGRGASSGPARTWLVYCHTASATTSGASGSILRKTSMPARLAVDEAVLLHGVVRRGRARSRAPSSREGPVHGRLERLPARASRRWLAESRESPLATRTTSFAPGFTVLMGLLLLYFSSIGKTGFSMGVPPM